MLFNRVGRSNSRDGGCSEYFKVDLARPKVFFHSWKKFDEPQLEYKTTVILIDHISNSRLYEKCGSVPLSWAIVRERWRWLGHVLRKKYDRLSKIVLLGQLSRSKRNTGRPWLRWEDVRKDLSEKGTSWEGVKRENLNRLELRKSVLSCVGLMRPDAAVRC